MSEHLLVCIKFTLSEYIPCFCIDITCLYFHADLITYSCFHHQVRPINYQDFQDALTQVRASVSQKDLDVYLDWNKQYGSWGVTWSTMVAGVWHDQLW